ncbi:hypothetical protein ACQKL5_17040 [Peribacillus sp. NPDC097675]
MKNQFNFRMIAKEMPCTFMVFDILQLVDNSLLNMPLIERKCLFEY